MDLITHMGRLDLEPIFILIEAGRWFPGNHRIRTYPLRIPPMPLNYRAVPARRRRQVARRHADGGQPASIQSSIRRRGQRTLAPSFTG